MYINSVIVPSAKADGTNEAISEQEIVDVFKHSVLVRATLLYATVVSAAIFL